MNHQLPSGAGRATSLGVKSRWPLSPFTVARAATFALAAWGSAIAAAPAFAGPTVGAVEGSALYGHDFDFWKKVDDFSKSGKSQADIFRLLDASFDHPEEGLATLGVAYRGPVDGELRGLADRVYVGAGADGLAGGVLRNRILPEVDAYAVYTGHVDLGVLQTVVVGASGWEYALGSTVGAGHASVVSGSVVDLVNHYAADEAALFYTGFDVAGGYRNRFNAALDSRFRLSLQPTFFTADHTDSAAQYKIQTEQVRLRWRQEDEWTLDLDAPIDPEFAVGLITIFGQQPTPLVFLPRTWDAIHSLEAWPSAGQLVGIGARLHLLGFQWPVGVDLDGGCYGGYWGTSARLRLWAVQAVVGSYGYEQSPGYRIDEGRINFVSIGGQFAL